MTHEDREHYSLYFQVKLVQNSTLSAKLSCPSPSTQLLDIYILGQPTLPYYFRYQLSSVPPDFTSHFSTLTQLFNFMTTNYLKGVTALWPHQDQQEAVIRFQMNQDECLWLSIPRVLKKRANFYEFHNKRRQAAFKLAKKQIQSLTKVADKYKQLEKVLQESKELILQPNDDDKKEQQAAFSARRSVPPDLFQDHPPPNTATKKFILSEQQFPPKHSEKKLIDKKQNPEKPQVKSKEGKLLEIKEEAKEINLQQAIQKGAKEYRKKEQNNRYFWSPLLKVITLPAIPDPNSNLISDQNKFLLIPPNFKNSFFRDKYLITREEDLVAITRKPSADRNFYHLHHHKPISHPREFIKAKLVNIPNHDFTLGILGKNALMKSRKLWSTQIVAYIGCTQTVVNRTEQKSAYALFKPGDYICAMVNMDERTIKFTYNQERLCETHFPTWTPDEYYFFFETATSGTKVSFSFHEY